MNYRQSDRSYRRGLFLGLTTAEISLLLVFMLLLLFTVPGPGGSSAGGGSQGAGGSADPATILQEQRRLAAALREDRDRWRDLSRRRAGENTVLQRRLDHFRELLRQEVRRTPSGPLTAAQAAALTRRTAALQAEVDTLVRERASLAASVSALEDEVSAARLDFGRAEAELLSARAEAAAALARADAAEASAREARRVLAARGSGPGRGGTGPGGSGSDHPSCWYDPDNHPEYVWDVALHEQGFLVRPGPAPHNASARAVLPLAATVLGRYVTPADFITQTRPLYDWSVEHDCRFFVRAYDDTPADAKLLYQTRMRTLESHFYKNAYPSGPPPRP